MRRSLADDADHHAVAADDLRRGVGAAEIPFWMDSTTLSGPSSGNTDFAAGPTCMAFVAMMTVATPASAALVEALMGTVGAPDAPSRRRPFSRMASTSRSCQVSMAQICVAGGAEQCGVHATHGAASDDGDLHSWGLRIGVNVDRGGAGNERKGRPRDAKCEACADGPGCCMSSGSRGGRR